MPDFKVSDPDFEARVRDSFARQTIMNTIGATMTKVGPGEIEIVLPFRDDLCQQNGFVHGGVVTTIVDSACGYSALTLTPANAGVLTIEFKVNFMSPAIGEKLIARGHVVKPGSNITVCAGDVYAVKDGKEKVVATMLTSLMVIKDQT